MGQWEGQDVPLVRPSSGVVKGGIPSSRRYLPTYLPGNHGHGIVGHNLAGAAIRKQRMCRCLENGSRFGEGVSTIT